MSFVWIILFCVLSMIIVCVVRLFSGLFVMLMLYVFVNVWLVWNVDVVMMFVRFLVV